MFPNPLISSDTTTFPHVEPISEPALPTQADLDWAGDVHHDPGASITSRQLSGEYGNTLQDGEVTTEHFVDYFSRGAKPAAAQQIFNSITSQSVQQRYSHTSDESASESINKPWEDECSQPILQHHHHVPQNAFLPIGLQTSMAIALHKLPEGFITYATNHANPKLGLTVFLALFIHNVTEGFALALPLFLALNSRWKAILWSSLLGGISQPAGAGIAALWIWGSNRRGDEADSDPQWGVYGGMFAATAGVMTSVALQLFCEALSLSHRPNLCIGSAIAGMGILGFCFALTA